MATQAERIEKLENDLEGALERIKDLQAILHDGETIDEIRDLLAKAAPLSDFETLTAKVEAHGRLLADQTTKLIDGTEIAGELVEGFGPRADLLKAFRQIEAIANQINVKLPS